MLINQPEHNNIRVEVKNQIVYLNGEDVGFFEVHDGSKVRVVYGPDQSSPSGYEDSVPKAIGAIITHAMRFDSTTGGSYDFRY